jgi:hypothetical protein
MKIIYSSFLQYYKAYMTEYCADFCASIPTAAQSSPSTQCGDKPGYTSQFDPKNKIIIQFYIWIVFSCIAWKVNGFCEGFDGFWNDEKVKEYCGATCRKC